MKLKLTLILSLFCISYSFSQDITLIRLNECDDSDLIEIKTYLESRLGVSCRISKNKFLYNDSIVLNCDKLNKMIYNSSYFEYIPKQPINIFVTKSKLCSRGGKVCGVSYGNQIYISTRKTYRTKIILTHELSHTFGAEHCDNICIMNIKYNPSSIEKIWDINSDNPKFCNRCRKYWRDI